MTLTASVRSTSQQISKTISDSNHVTRLVRGRQPLDYRLDTSPLRMFGTSMLPLIIFYQRIIIDLTQVWPAFWSKGPHWPDNGEIDTIEGVNLMVCFSPSPTPTLRSAEVNPGCESVCAAHAAGMFAASRCTTNRCVRRNRLFATEWMFCFRVESQQLRRWLCYSWRWGLGHTIRRGWYFVR